MARRHLIIGGGTAGMNAIRTIREEEAERSEITLVSSEKPYSRMVLPYYLDRSIAESHVFTATAAVLAGWGVKSQLGRRATKLETTAKTCTLDDGATVEYDDCLVATGSSPVKAPVPGADLPGVHSFWTLDQCRSLIADIRPGSHVVMVGAGFIAFTILNSILALGARLTIVEIAPKILPRMIDATGADLVTSWLERHGVTVRAGARLAKIEDAKGKKRLTFAKGADILCDVVIMATGIRTNLEWLKGSDVRINQAIVVDDHLRSSVPTVYGAGDVAEGPDRGSGAAVVHAIEPTAQEHGRVAGANMAGKDVRYRGSVLMNIVEVCHLDVASFGAWDDSRAEIITGLRADRPAYRKLLWSGDRLTGAIILGPSSDIWTTNDVGMLKGLVQSQVPLGRFKEYLRANPFDIKSAYIAAKTKTAGVAPELPGAYAGKLLRVDMTKRKCWAEAWSPEEMRQWLGGAGLGALLLYRETATRGGKGNVAWDHPDNRLVLATGPLAGLPVWGTGALTVITIGAMTNGPTSTQANGFFGTNLKYCGYDAIVIQGQSKDWLYLHIHDDVIELRDARTLVGLDTWETQEALSRQLGLSGHQLSVYAIGPAGEKLVRFAAIHGDYGHVASKNGCGAVMGKKRLKAVAIVKGTKALSAADYRGVIQVADDIAHDLKTDPSAKSLYEYGTLPGVVNLGKLGVLPIKNYTTNVPYDDLGRWEAPKLREGFDHRGHQCNACGMHHCHMQVIRGGAFKGAIVDEPEYEGWSGCGWTIGATDQEGVSWLNTEVDRACVDVNEFGWVCGWVMEGVEQGWITRAQLGFDLKWGDIKGAHRLLQMLTHRQGFGDLLAEGVKIAAERLGGRAKESAVYTLQGASPRGHDHRARWDEMLDTCTGSTGTLESGVPVHVAELGLPTRINPFNGVEVATQVAGIRGRRHFEDSLGICIFTGRTRMENLCRALSAATGWYYTVDDGMRMGRRTAAVFRAIRLRCGIGLDRERPSIRYGSTPHDGPAKGQAVSEQWEQMVDTWYDQVGYDRKTGKPRLQTLRDLGLDWLARDLWGKKA